MKNKENMNIILAVVICLAVVGVIVFISRNNNKANMTSNNDANSVAMPDQTISPADNTTITGNGDNGEELVNRSVGANVDSVYKKILDTL